jgi:hypothetical protein
MPRRRLVVLRGIDNAATTTGARGDPSHSSVVALIFQHALFSQLTYYLLSVLA